MPELDYDPRESSFALYNALIAIASSYDMSTPGTREFQEGKYAMSRVYEAAIACRRECSNNG